jgi:hypothetical protein
MIMRKKIWRGLALAIAGLLFYFAVWPFLIGGRRMKAFCASVAPGTPSAALESLADDRGYRIAPPFAPDKPMLVFDPRARGRFTCSVWVQDGRVTSTRYGALD